MAKQRLKAEFPALYADLQAGRIGSVQQALRMAGLKPAKPRVPQLQKIWAKATADEQQAFSRWLILSGAVAPPALPADRPLASGRYLLPETIARLEAILKRRGLTPGAVMEEMGFGANDPALTLALARKSSLRLAVIAALRHWLDANDTL